MSEFDQWRKAAACAKVWGFCNDKSPKLKSLKDSIGWQKEDGK